MYGVNVGAAPAIYVLSYFGENITNGTVSVTTGSATIDLPAVDSDINVFVAAMNVFGTGGDSDILMGEISELLSPIVHMYINIRTYMYAYTTIYVQTYCMLM